MKTWLKRIAIGIVIILVLATIGFVWWGNTPLKAMPEAITALESDNDVLVINKLDYMELTEFDLKLLRERVQTLNQGVPIFPLSCKTFLGFEKWVDWFEQEILSFQKDPK